MTIEEIQARKEYQTFDCKSIQIDPKALAIPMFDDRLVFETPGDLFGLVRPDNIRHTHFSRNPKIAQYLKAYKYVKEFGEGIDRICSELETKGCAIPSFHVDAFILKATLMAEWTTENEFDRSSTVQVPSNYRPSTVQVEKLVQLMHDEYLNVSKMMELCGIKHRMTFRDNYINPALSDGSIERKYPDQPNHPKQMYRLTEQAKVWKLNNID